MKEEHLHKLEYSKIWLDSNILTENILSQQINEFEKGEDTNTEHYRYKTFKTFFETQANIDDQLLTQLFSIIKCDKDASMASAMTMDILKSKKITDSQFTQVGNFLKETFGTDMQKYIDAELSWREKRKQMK